MVAQHVAQAALQYGIFKTLNVTLPVCVVRDPARSIQVWVWLNEGIALSQLFLLFPGTKLLCKELVDSVNNGKLSTFLT